ncbi:MAG: hypothetical protein ACRDUA_01115 [Micromonosporaceae bacterium]
MPAREDSFVRLVLAGGAYCWVAPVLVAVFGRSQLFAGVLGVLGLVTLAVASTRLPGLGEVESLYREDRWLAVAAGLVAISPVILLGYAVTGQPYVLAAMILAGTAALVLLFVVRGEWAGD